MKLLLLLTFHTSFWFFWSLWYQHSEYLNNPNAIDISHHILSSKPCHFAPENISTPTETCRAYFDTSSRRHGNKIKYICCGLFDLRESTRADVYAYFKPFRACPSWKKTVPHQRATYSTSRGASTLLLMSCSFTLDATPLRYTGTNVTPAPNMYDIHRIASADARSVGEIEGERADVGEIPFGESLERSGVHKWTRQLTL